MAKKDSFDDVLGNKFSLMNAKSSKLLSSWMGADTTPTPTTNDVSDTPDDDADLKQSDFGHDRLGVGSAIPKEIADGSFTRRAPTSNDKLLEQLIGKKRAKAHLAAKQEAERASARQQPAWQSGKEETKKKKKAEESEDEEDGRAAVLMAKRRRVGGDKLRSEGVRGEVRGVDVHVDVDVNANVDVDVEGEVERESKGEDVASGEQPPASKEESDVDLKPKKRVKKSRAKPTSYLDELLAERSKKKKGKGKGGEEV